MFNKDFFSSDLAYEFETIVAKWINFGALTFTAKIKQIVEELAIFPMTAAINSNGLLTEADLRYILKHYRDKT